VRNGSKLCQINLHILVLALSRQSCKLKAKAISHLPSLLAVTDAIYLTFSGNRYLASRCQYSRFLGRRF